MNAGVLSLGRSDDRGEVSVLVAAMVATMALLMVLVVDGSSRFKALNQADTYAAEAARAASAAVGPNPTGGQVDVVAAAGAATAYLQAAGAEGQATVVGPARVEVRVVVTRRGPITGREFTASITRTAQLQVGVETGLVPR